MFAIYKVYDKQPSGRPESKWSDWSFSDGKTVEKQLLTTVSDEKAAQDRVETEQRATKNTIYYQEVP